MTDRSDKLDKMAVVTTKRFNAGPQPRPKPGEMHISGWEWWDDFWKGVTMKPRPQAEKALVDAEPPERREMSRAAQEMTDQELKAYANARGWTSFPGMKRGDYDNPTVGTELLRDVVRKEFQRRKIIVSM
jgi:hypothetical protein